MHAGTKLPSLKSPAPQPLQSCSLSAWKSRWTTLLWPEARSLLGFIHFLRSKRIKTYQNTFGYALVTIMLDDGRLQGTQPATIHMKPWWLSEDNDPSAGFAEMYAPLNFGPFPKWLYTYLKDNLKSGQLLPYILLWPCFFALAFWVTHNSTWESLEFLWFCDWIPLFKWMDIVMGASAQPRTLYCTSPEEWCKFLS